VDLIVNSDYFSVVGFTELIWKYRKIKKAQNLMIKALNINKPDLLILVDYVEFNLKLGKIAKALKIPVLFYVSPQIWAWRPSRLDNIERSVDALAVILPFEPEIYKNTNVKAEFVGHPLMEILPFNDDKEQSKKRLGINSGHQPVVSFLPGSRKSEIDNHIAIIFDVIIKLSAIYPEALFMIAFANGRYYSKNIEQEIKKLRDVGVAIEVRVGATYDVIIASDAVAVASGTAALEVSLLNRPMTVFYKLSYLSHRILKYLMLTKFISLPNIILGQEFVKEYIQTDMTSENLASHLKDLISNIPLRNKQKIAFANLKKIMGAKLASKNVANMALKLMDK
jgi:lipid-A-disaccharide synthase